MDTSRFGSIKCNWKISSNADTTRSFIIRLATDTDPQLDYHASELNLAPVLNPLTLRGESKTNVNQKDTSKDSCSFLEYSSWFSPSSTLNRTMLLAAEEGTTVLVQVPQPPVGDVWIGKLIQSSDGAVVLRVLMMFAKIVANARVDMS